MFIPKKSKIFEKLEEQSLIVERASKIFQRIVHNWGQLKDGCAELETLEGEADEFVHTITDEIEMRFILPLDKEDIKELTESLDNIVDNIEQAANRLNIYKIPQTNEALKEFSNLLLQSIQQIHQGILMIKEHKFSSKEFIHYYKNLHAIENRGDKLHRKVLENLMGGSDPDFGGKDPILILKWKEIFQTLEDTLDQCEDIAVLFDRLRIKYK